MRDRYSYEDWMNEMGADEGLPELPPMGHPLQKLGARLGELLDEDHWAECERLLLEGWEHDAADRATGARSDEWIEGYAAGVRDGRKDALLTHQPSPTPQADSQPEPVHGDLLPPVGSRVFIRHGRDDDAHACTVTGYYAWGDLRGDKRLHRVFVRMVYEGTSIEQARMLCDCYPTPRAAIDAARRQGEKQ